MKKNETISYIMLFCGLMLVRKSRIKLHDLAALFPYHSRARFLAQELAGAPPRETATSQAEA